MCKSELLLRADREGYAVPAFNYSDIWELLAIVEAAREERAPVYIASNERTVRSLGIGNTGSVGRQLQGESNMSIVNHLDHATDVELCKQAVDNGYASVMIDASMQALEENIRAVREVVEYAHPRMVVVEAEIGRIVGNNAEGTYTGQDYLADVGEAARLVEATGVDSLAVGLGNAHGFYQEKPRLDFDRLEEINRAVQVPLVLHGGTGIPGEDIQKCIRMGISKVNVGTLLHSTYLKALRRELDKERTGYCIPDIFDEVKEAIKKDVRAWIRVCMADGKLQG